ncbi:MAG: hypothetical protein K2X86_08905 [Cytophagaceae bacterium]|nr:hypothetical protein [Cytophagaceae bacterium]
MKSNQLDLKLKYIVIQHVVVILIGIGIFYIDEVEFLDGFYPKLFLLILAFAKCIYFIGHSFKKIEEASLNNFTYNKFLVIILTNIFLIILSFAVDYSCLYEFDSNSFQGLTRDGSMFTIFYDFFYFSVLTFTTTGFGDIIPLTKPAKFLVTIEVIVAFITTIIVIFNFIHIKDSIHELSFLKLRKKPFKSKEMEEVETEN